MTQSGEGGSAAPNPVGEWIRGRDSGGRSRWSWRGSYLGTSSSAECRLLPPLRPFHGHFSGIGVHCVHCFPPAWLQSAAKIVEVVEGRDTALSVPPVILPRPVWGVPLGQSKHEINEQNELIPCAADLALAANDLLSLAESACDFWNEVRMKRSKRTKWAIIVAPASVDFVQKECPAPGASRPGQWRTIVEGSRAWKSYRPLPIGASYASDGSCLRR
jgi:hypothetical protein